MRRPAILAVFVVLVASAVGIVALVSCDGKPQVALRPESLHSRVLNTKKIRCSYCAYPPYCIKDPNTGEFSGIFVDVMEAIGDKLAVDIDWVEEVGWGTIFEGLESGRYDVHGSGLWQNASRGKKGYFSIPLFYNAIRVWVRSDESRFRTLEDLNSPEVRISVQDGAIEAIIAETDFPRAQPVSIPQLNPWSDNLLNIITNKADVTFAELGVIVPFLEKNPGTLKELPVGRPIRVFANSYPFKMGEGEFKSMIDSAIAEIISDGTMETILERYEKSPGEHLRVAPSYILPGDQ